MSNFLTEHLTYDAAKMMVESIDNGEGKGKSLFMKGIFIQGGVRNLNERVYPVREIEKAVDNVNDILREGGSVLGECDHPAELTINLDRVSHVIESMWMDGNSGFGKLKILPTPMGNIIRTLTEAGVKLGVSSRGSGNVNDRGEVSDFEIVTVDVVARPSAPNAYPKPVYEARNSKRGNVITDLAEAVAHDPKAQKHFHKELLNWINNR
ncbi:MAG: hypothetical protein EOP83_20930 [Verrucomicrobiaceae bacterium]|nr:MAG: hypothetical protein EOP83_20930 [Verrucomicrobiaceae bacterium]